MSRRGLIALGVGQCITWGVLYYAFAVLVVPLQRELRVETWVVTGAFSLALLMSAVLAPAVGRWADRGHAPLVMQFGSVAAIALLIVWTLVPGVAALYALWAGLGLCMAATLYEPAFAIVGRAYKDPAARLRALAAVTLFGGLASTAFLPATAFLVTAVGWRGAVIVLATVLVVSTLLTRQCTFRTLVARGPLDEPSAGLPRPLESASLPFVLVAGMFTLATLASGALVANLIPALGEQGVAPTSAALVGGVMGAMQLPGRVLLMNGIFGSSPSRMLALSLALHAGGLGLIAFGASPPIVVAGTMVFALGAGLTALVRPHLVQTMFSLESGGRLNGRIARQQQLARAAGPIVVAWVASRLSYAVVLAVLAGVFAVGALTALRTLSERRRSAADAEVA